jgi:DNA-binding NarL/FixJ family response regulator
MKKIILLVEDNGMIRESIITIVPDDPKRIKVPGEMLTRREIEIASLITEGKSSEEIAGLLFISKYTVNNHRQSIKRKLEYNNLAQLPSKLKQVWS